MSELVKSLENDWDILLFDSPPLVAVTDATMISKEIDKIVIVVKVGQTDKRAFEYTIRALENVQAPLGGIVLNAVTYKIATVHIIIIISIIITMVVLTNQTFHK